MIRLSEVKEQLRSPLPWHVAGVVILAILALVLGVRFSLDWIATSGSTSDELQNRQTQLRMLEIQTAPLRGIDKRVDESRAQMKTFYEKRIPTTYSTIATHLGDIAVKNGVRLTRAQYSPGKPGADLTEVKLDATLGGDYTGVMRTLNGIERDQIFFVIRSMNLSGQQAGMVNLRLQVSVWMRPTDAANMPVSDVHGADDTNVNDDGSDKSPDTGAKKPVTKGPAKEGV